MATLLGPLLTFHIVENSLLNENILILTSILIYFKQGPCQIGKAYGSVSHG